MPPPFVPVSTTTPPVSSSKTLFHVNLYKFYDAWRSILYDHKGNFTKFTSKYLYFFQFSTLSKYSNESFYT
jgi:hypothetical protein